MFYFCSGILSAAASKLSEVDIQQLLSNLSPISPILQTSSSPHHNQPSAALNCLNTSQLYNNKVGIKLKHHSTLFISNLDKHTALEAEQQIRNVSKDCSKLKEF